MNISTYRAKKIDTNKYIQGYLLGMWGEYFISWGETNHVPNKVQIDPTTLAIHFSNMVDSEGNKIFASLSEDGKGGDIIHRDGMTFETIYKSVNGRFEAYEINGMHHLLAHKFHQTKIIGIQQ